MVLSLRDAAAGSEGILSRVAQPDAGSSKPVPRRNASSQLPEPGSKRAPASVSAPRASRARVDVAGTAQAPIPTPAQLGLHPPRAAARTMSTSGSQAVPPLPAAHGAKGAASSPRQPSAGLRVRVPVTRGPLVARPQLLSRLDAGFEAGHLITVVAGPGFGKSTLIAQWLATLPADTRIGWVSGDRIDASPVARFRALLETLNALYPDFPPFDVDGLCRLASASEDGAYRASAEVGAALAERGPGRLVWVWDDVHVVQKAWVWRWIDQFIELMPEQVTILLLSRERLGIALARRRARGALTEIGQADLCFSADETGAFVAQGAADPAWADRERVEALCRRTGGWVSGLKLMGARRDASIAEVVRDDVWEYLAEEVIHRLPPPLQSFLDACAVLDEIEPASAAVLAGLADAGKARALIEDLVRRNLWITVSDPQRQVVRLHDLLRDFLDQRMQRVDPARHRSLHAAAAALEPDPVRSVHHLLQAGEPARAVRLLAEHTERLLKAGRADSLRAQLDAAGADVPRAPACWVEGWLAWQRLDFPSSQRWFADAVDAFAADGDALATTRSRMLLSRVASYAGDVAAAAAQLALIDRSSLDPVTGCEMLLEDAWMNVALGRPAEAGAALAATAERMEAMRSAEVCTRLADRMRSHFAGTPGFAEAFERMYRVIDTLAPQLDSQTVGHGRVIGTWAALWGGRLDDARSRLALLGPDLERWRAFRALRVDAGVLTAILAVIDGRVADACDEVERLLVREPGADNGSAATWNATYLWLMGRFAWQSEELRVLRQVHARLLTLHRSTEWPFMTLARVHLEGLILLQQGDAAAAADKLAAAAAQCERFSTLVGFGDPRIEWADALLRAGRTAEAWQAAERPLREAVATGWIGPLLLSHPGALARVGGLAPAGHPDRLAIEALVERTLALRGRAPAAEPASQQLAPVARPAGAGSAADAGAGASLAELTAREREVLGLVVQGAPNKRIAQRLDLSLHTVKRHVANILGKTGALSRAELIARFLGRL